MKKFLYFLTCIIIVFCFSGCETKVDISDTTTTTTEATTLNSTQTTQKETTTQTAVVSETAIVITETQENTQPITTPAPVPKPNIPVTTQPEKTTSPVTTTTTSQLQEGLNKTGTMAFSDSPDNRYVNAIAKKYKVPAKTLVALYTVPENDSNIVLEFDGTKNDDGTLKRNKDTLIAIYSINKNLDSKRASEDESLNEYTYGEMKVMFFSTTTYIMPEFDQFD
jgi:CxxC motif-containing protein